MRFVQLNPSFIGRPPGLQQTERQLFPVFMWIKPLDLRDFRISKPRRFAPSKPRVLSIPGAHQVIGIDTNLMVLDSLYSFGIGVGAPPIVV